MKLGTQTVLWFMFIFPLLWQQYAMNSDVTSAMDNRAKFIKSRRLEPHKINKLRNKIIETLKNIALVSEQYE